MKKSQPSSGNKRPAPLSFRIEDDISLELQAAAWSEHRKRGELARLLFEWAFEKYKIAGSYDALIGRETKKARL
jgi:hypothetical protein